MAEEPTIAIDDAAPAAEPSDVEDRIDPLRRLSFPVEAEDNAALVRMLGWSALIGTGLWIVLIVVMFL